MTALDVIHICASLYALAGFGFVTIQAIGIVRDPMTSLIALDQWLAANLLPDAYADETISAWAHRTHRKRTERFINWIFDDENHCAMSYVSEMRGYQNAPEYSAATTSSTKA